MHRAARLEARLRAARRGRRAPSSGFDGAARHALRYILSSWCDTAELKLCSVALRLQFLEMAGHDLAFVRRVPSADRRLLELAGRRQSLHAHTSAPPL